MRNVSVLGSFIVDLAFQGERLPVPGETVFGKFIMGPGGKGSNQAVAAKLAGANVGLITALGDDIFADVALQFYNKIGMRDRFIYCAEDSHTGVASIAVETKTGQNQIMVAPGVCDMINEDVIRQASRFLNAKIFLTQFECNLAAVVLAINLAKKKYGALTILNPAPAKEFDDGILACVDIIVPNETEASLITGVPLTVLDFHKQAAEKLAKKVGTVIITLGEKGVYCPSVSEDILPPFKVKAIDTTGAGDAFCGALAAALAGDLPLAKAIRFAQAGAAISVTRNGTSPAMPRREEIEELLKS